MTATLPFCTCNISDTNLSTSTSAYNILQKVIELLHLKLKSYEQEIILLFQFPVCVSKYSPPTFDYFLFRISIWYERRLNRTEPSSWHLPFSLCVSAIDWILYRNTLAFGYTIMAFKDMFAGCKIGANLMSFLPSSLYFWLNRVPSSTVVRIDATAIFS